MTRRLIFLMIALELVIFHLTYEAVVFPVLAILAAGFGLLGGPRFEAPLRRRSIYALALLLPFVAQWQLLPFDSPTVRGLSGSGVTYVFVQYFVALQLLELFLRKQRSSAAVPLYGALAVTCAGNVFLTSRLSALYGLVCLVLMAVSVMYLRARAGTFGPARPGRRRPALVPVAIFLMLVGVTAMMLSGALYTNQQTVARFIADMLAPQLGLNDSGYSGKAKLGSVIRLKEGSAANKTALRVFSETAPGYLRGNVFDYYSLNSEWKDMSTLKVLRPVARPPALPEFGPKRKFFTLKEHGEPPWRSVEVWPSRNIQTGMFCPKETAVTAAPIRTLTLDSNGAIDSSDIRGGVNYTLFAPGRNVPDKLSDGDRARFSAVPESIDPRIVELARTVFADARTPREKMHAVADHFTNNYRYDVGIRIPWGADPMTHFLIKRPAAHCEYFASGAALLLRIGGVPSRYVTGFVADEWNPFGKYWMARNRNAHAWVQAYDDETGWHLVEATPGSGVPRGGDASTADYLADFASFRLQELQVSTYVGGMRGLLAWLGDRAATLLARAMSGSAGMVALKACILILLVRFLWRRRRGPRQPRERDPRVRALHALLAKADAAVRKLGLARGAHETLHQFARRIVAEIASGDAGAPAAEWYAAYATVRYGGAITDADIERLRRTLPARNGRSVNRNREE